MSKGPYPDIYAGLKATLLDEPEIAMVHSCVGGVGLVAGLNDNPVQVCLDAWLSCLPVGTTLVMPTFTFSFCSHRQFDPQNTPSETGELSEMFRRHPGVVRTKHPIYSVAAYGAKADEIGHLIGDTCFGAGSIFEFLERHNALIVGFGVPLARAGTIMHRPEELLGVPYRYAKQFVGTRKTETGEERCETSFYVRRLDLDVGNDFSPVIDRLYELGLQRRVALGKGAVESVYAQDLCQVERELLAEDSLAIVAKRERVREELAKESIAFLGSANLDLLAQAVEDEYKIWDHSGLRTIPVPFGQYRPYLIDRESLLRVANPSVLVFLERLEDLCGEMILDPYGCGMETFRTRLEEYLKVIREARAVLDGLLVIATFCPTLPSVLISADRYFAEGLTAMIDYGNRRLAEELGTMGGVHMLDMASVLAGAGSQQKDRKYWYLGKIPFGQAGSQALAQRLAGAVLAHRGKTARILVLDLDNTLWGGVVGEDGIEGIQIGGDYPGNAFRDFQRAVKLLQKRGLVLAIASKNDEATALEAVENHAEMLLRTEDFLTWRINWQDKAGNIRSICSELGLGLAAVCFLDDNPSEREWVKAQLPEVHVPELPDDPCERPQFLLRLPCLDLLSLTDEDSQRNEQYRAERALQVQSQTFADIEEFYSSLDMVVTLCNYDSDNKMRVLQLIGKTNQFNTTTRRYNEVELEGLLAQGADVYAIRLKDRIRSEEVIGVLILTWSEEACRIDTFLLSCRVLGYGVEKAVLGWVKSQAEYRDVACVQGELIETPRNQVVRNLYREGRFKEQKPGFFSLQPLSEGIDIPDWIEMIIAESKEFAKDDE